MGVTVAVGPLAAQRIKLPVKLSELEDRVRKDSNDAAAHYNVALGYLASKRYDDAERALRTAVTIEPQLAPAWLALGRMPFARSDRLWEDIHEGRVSDSVRNTLRGADRLYRRAFLIDPVVELRIEAAVRPPKSVYWTATEALSRIYDYVFGGFEDIEAGRYEAAYNRINRLIDDAPTKVEREGMANFVYYYRGLAAAHISRWDDAIRDFGFLFERMSRHQNPDSLTYHIPIETNQYRYMLAVLKHRAGKLEEAVQLYREALENDAGLYMAHVRLAEIAEMNRNWDQAIAERRNAANANPDDPSLLLDLGKAYAGAGRLAEAEETLRQAMDASPRDSRVPYYLGVVAQLLQKRDDARAAFDRFLALAPSRYDRQIADAKQRLVSLQ